MIKIIIASTKDWFRKNANFEDFENLSIFEISKKEDLNLNFISQIKPKYIFFPHWNWKVNKEIFEAYNCIVFHTAPLPYGRGGSPIQNLILKGYETSPVNALVMSDDIDGGDIYLKEQVSLQGNIDQIYKRIALVIKKMIIEIIENNPIPISQTGNPTFFKRLSIKDNELLSNQSLKEMYDRIRMVDGIGYPKAYINFGNYKIEFTNSKLLEDNLTANIKISEIKKF